MKVDMRVVKHRRNLWKMVRRLQQSSSAFDRAGSESGARPRIVRGFRPESLADESDERLKMSASLSFNENAPPTTTVKTYDGREVTMVTMNCQTDWEWVSKKEIGIFPMPDKSSADSRRSGSITSRASSKDESPDDSPHGPDTHMPYNDEYGIPILDLSSDTDDYQRESQKHELNADDPEARLEEEEGRATSPDKDEGPAHGMFSGNCEFCKQSIKPFPTIDDQTKLPPESLYCCNDYKEFVEFVVTTTQDMEDEEHEKTKIIDVKPHEHVGTKQERNAAKEKAVQRMRERELQRRQQEASGLPQNFFAFARQMKTINYQLSSQKCLEEGWTIRAPSPLFDDEGDDVFIPEPLRPEMLVDGKLRDRPLIDKYYASGQKFLTMFPDGTGNVFYPSGRLAIMITSVKLGQYYYTIHHDVEKSGVAAAFEPNGYGYCYFPNGDIRLYIDQYGGIELDNVGARRRRWSWKDQVTHVHAPPFQPICIGLNKTIGVRVMSQENIALTYSSAQRSCRFNMGSRLKLVNPDNAPLKEIEEDYIFLEEKKTQVDALLCKVANLLKFPNNPKLEKMLPPLHVTSKQIKCEKLKKDRQHYLDKQSARDKKQTSISVT